MGDIRSCIVQKKLYHGTLKKFKDAILESGFTVSTREDNYLGTGVYFYEEPKLAVIWAQKKATYCKDSPVVFETVLSNSSVLDLTDDSVSREVENFVAQIDRQCVLRKRKLRKRQIMAQKATMYIDTYCNKVGIDIVKGRVYCGERMILYDAGIIYRTEVQYCVRNPSIISKTIVAYAEESDYDAI